MAKKKAAKKKEASKPEDVLDRAREYLLSRGKAFVVAFENPNGAMEVCMFAPTSKDALGLAGLITMHAQGIVTARNPGFHEHIQRAAAVQP